MAYIAIDFDGTCVTHEFPKVGKDIGAVPVLKCLINNGHKLILNTMRSTRDAGGSNIDEHGNILKTNVLQCAIDWFRINNIELFGINVNPTQSKWTSSPKVFAHLYIDDAALGCPLIYNPNISENSFVDWIGIAKLLVSRKLINEHEYNECIKEINKILIKSENSCII